MRCIKTAMPSVGTGDQKWLNSSHQYPTTRPTTNAPKVEWIGLWNFASSTLITWLLANQPPLLQSSQQLFAVKTFPPPTRGRKCFPRVHRILKHGFLRYRNKLLFLIGKNLLIVMVPILINKDVFKPSYNDFKFTVQNHNNVCTNLIFALIHLKTPNYIYSQCH